MIAQRVLAVLAAILLVSAVGIATFGAQSLSLGEFLMLVDNDMLDWLPEVVGRFGGSWAWAGIIQPLLVRPAWLLPASAGLICVGLSLSMSGGKTHRSRRRS